jgi:hypothetical protein
MDYESDVVDKIVVQIPDMPGHGWVTHLPVKLHITSDLAGICIGMLSCLVVYDDGPVRECDYAVGTVFAAVSVEYGTLVEYCRSVLREPPAGGSGSYAVLQEREILLSFQAGDAAVKDGRIDGTPEILRGAHGREYIVKDNASQTF